MYESSFFQSKMNAYAKFMMQEKLMNQEKQLDRIINTRSLDKSSKSAASEMNGNKRDSADRSARNLRKQISPEDSNFSAHSKYYTKKEGNSKPRSRSPASRSAEHKATNMQERVGVLVDDSSDSDLSKGGRARQSIRVVARALGPQSKSEDEKPESQSTTSAKITKYRKIEESNVVEMASKQLIENEKSLGELKKKAAVRLREKREAQLLKEKEEAAKRENEEAEARKKLDAKLDKYENKKQPVVEEKKTHSRFPLIGKMPFFRNKPLKKVGSGQDNDSKDKTDKSQDEDKTVDKASPNSTRENVKDPKFSSETTTPSPTPETESSPSVEELNYQSKLLAEMSSSNDATTPANQLLKVIALNKKLSAVRKANDDSSSTPTSPASPTLTCSTGPLPVDDITSTVASKVTPSVTNKATSPSVINKVTMSPVTKKVQPPSVVNKVPLPPLPTTPIADSFINPPPPLPPTASSAGMPSNNSNGTYYNLPSYPLPPPAAAANVLHPPPTTGYLPPVPSTQVQSPVVTDPRPQNSTPPPPGTEMGDDEDDADLLPPGVDAPAKSAKRHSSADIMSSMLYRSVPTKDQITNLMSNLENSDQRKQID